MIDTIIFSGTGMNFVQLVGVIKILEENDIMNHIKNIYCSSGSTFLSFMIGLGMNS